MNKYTLKSIVLAYSLLTGALILHLAHREAPPRPDTEVFSEFWRECARTPRDEGPFLPMHGPVTGILFRQVEFNVDPDNPGWTKPAYIDNYHDLANNLFRQFGNTVPLYQWLPPASKRAQQRAGARQETRYYRLKNTSAPLVSDLVPRVPISAANVEVTLSVIPFNDRRDWRWMQLTVRSRETGALLARQMSPLLLLAYNVSPKTTFFPDMGGTVYAVSCPQEHPVTMMSKVLGLPLTDRVIDFRASYIRRYPLPADLARSQQAVQAQ